MKIKDKNFYYGAALAQIAEYPTFTSINKVTEKEGLYQINKDTRILIKYSSADEEWRFTFRKDDFEYQTMYNFHIVLVCGGSTICLLSDNEIMTLLDPDEEQSQWISVTYPDGGRMRVSGSLGDLQYTVAHDAFPRNIFGATTRENEVHLWPPFSQLNFYKCPPESTISSVNRTLDLADTLASNVSYDEAKTIYFGLSTISHFWNEWSEDNVSKVETLITDGIESDGFKVEIERITNVILPSSRKHLQSKLPALCSDEFIWKLVISVAD